MADDPIHTDGGTAETNPSDPEQSPEDTSGPSAEEEPPEALLEEIEDSLSEDGFDVFHGREFISVREGGQLAPNSTVIEQYLSDVEAVILAYNDGENTIAVIPLETYFEKPNVYKIHGGEKPIISARNFLKDNGIEPTETIRYRPEWDESIGGNTVAGGLRIDLDKDGERVLSNTSAAEDDTE